MTGRVQRLATQATRRATAFHEDLGCANERSRLFNRDVNSKSCPLYFIVFGKGGQFILERLVVHKFLDD